MPGQQAEEETAEEGKAETRTKEDTQVRKMTGWNEKIMSNIQNVFSKKFSKLSSLKRHTSRNG